MLVRIKHPDPNARISLAETGPDAKGGFQINMDKLAVALAMGWKVVNVGEDDPAPAPEVKAAAEPVNDPVTGDTAKPVRPARLKGAGAP